MTIEDDLEDGLYIYRSRHVCDVLEEMRVCLRTLNLSGMQGLIEEVQVMANRMESGLGERKAYYKMAKKLREEVIRLRFKYPEGDGNDG